MITIKIIRLIILAILLLDKGLIQIAHGFLTQTLIQGKNLTQTDLPEYLRDAKQNVVILHYPQLFIFSTAAISDFRSVSMLLEEDPRCEFVTVQSETLFDGDMTSLEPVMSYHRNGQTKKYEGPLNSAYILGYLSHENVCEMRVKDVTHFNKIQKLLPAGHVMAYMLFGKDQHDPDLFEHVREYLANQELAVPLFFVPDPETSNHIYRTYNSDKDSTPKMPNIFVYRNMKIWPMNKMYNGDMKNVKAIDEFLLDELVPPIHPSNSYMLPKFLLMRKTIVYIYTKGDKLTNYLSYKWIEEVPKKHKDKLIFLHSKGSEIVENKMNSILAIDSEYEVAAVRAFVIDLQTMDFYKFKPLSLEDGTLDEQGLNRFIDDLEQERLGHYVKSELPIPEHIDRGPVKTIVGEDFHKRVIESKDDVLILFLSSWCGHCHIAKRLFRDIGRRLKGSQGPVVATFDAYNNEVEDMEITKFPTIALYQSGNKENPVFYDGEHNIEAISSFLERNCKHNRVSAENIVQKHVSTEPIFEFHTEL